MKMSKKKKNSLLSFFMLALKGGKSFILERSFKRIFSKESIRERKKAILYQKRVKNSLRVSKISKTGGITKVHPGQLHEYSRESTE
jgi:hypothetical protein